MSAEKACPRRDRGWAPVFRQGHAPLALLSILLAIVPVLAGKDELGFEQEDDSAIADAYEKGFETPADFAAEIAARHCVASYAPFAVKPRTLREDYLQNNRQQN